MKKRKSISSWTKRIGRRRVFDSKKLLRSAEGIMDGLQSVSIRAGYAGATEADKEAKRAYARKAKGLMKRLARAAGKSDNPFLKEGYFDKWAERLEKAGE